MPCTTPPAVWPSTTFGLIMTPQSSEITYRRILTMPVSWSTSTVTAWQALENMYCGALYRLETSMPSSASGGSAPGLMAAAAIWASVTLLPSGSPLIRATLSVISRSPGSISSSCPATASTRSRMAAPASCAAPPPPRPSCCRR